MAGISSKAAGSLTNRYNFNGIEHENDFDLNYSEAFYRTIDPQTGRFLQIDPVTTHDESPYVMMGNNPVKNIDWLGNYFTWGSQDVHDRYDRLRKDNNEKLSGYMKELGGLDLNSSDEKVQNRICELQSLINISTGLNSQWDEMESSDVEFNVADGKTGFGGVTYYNSDKHRIDIVLSENNLEGMSHEIRHGYGYMKGEMVGTNGAADPLYDMMDEVSAYNSGLLFSKFKGYDKKVANGYFSLDMLTTRGALRSKAYDGIRGKNKQLTLNTPAAAFLNVLQDPWMINYIKINSSNANLTIGDVLKAKNDKEAQANRPPVFIFGDALKNR